MWSLWRGLQTSEADLVKSWTIFHVCGWEDSVLWRCQLNPRFICESHITPNRIPKGVFRSAWQANVRISNERRMSQEYPGQLKNVSKSRNLAVWSIKAYETRVIKTSDKCTQTHTFYKGNRRVHIRPPIGRGKSYSPNLINSKMYLCVVSEIHIHLTTYDVL